jgi:peptidoglycan/xylan/chitin deacetylase (PgdA/CDA1 family)
MYFRPFTRWAILSVTVVGAVFLAVHSGTAEESQDTNQSIASQMDSDVNTAIVKNSEAKSQAEWVNSGYTPADLFANFRSLAKDKPELSDALCRKLESLNQKDLALFEDELRSEKNVELLPCADDLTSKLDAYWKQNLKIVTKLMNQKREKQAGPPVPATLPSIEKQVDLSTTPVYFNADLPQGQIAITFDDGPHPTRTAQVLQILKNYGVRATFFEMGDNIKNMPDVTRSVYADGHSIGSHTMSHPQLPKLAMKSMQEAEDEITNARTMLQGVLALNAPFFRFPYGARTTALQAFVKQQGMASFFWNMDTLDWKIRDPKALLDNVLAEMNREKNSGIILFHDVHEQTVQTLPLVLEEMKTRHVTTVVFVPMAK